jgi:hypothetical protein
MFLRLIGIPSSPVVHHPFAQTMISCAVSSEIATVESLRENELQEARDSTAMLASEGLKTRQVNIESEFQPFSEGEGFPAVVLRY